MSDFTNAHFDGETYDPKRDQARLSGQAARIFKLMKDGEWRTLSEISRLTGDPESSVSARLRDFRKPRFGSHTVNRRMAIAGLYYYQLEIKQ
jgi:hypothetical protein